MTLLLAVPPGPMIGDAVSWPDLTSRLVTWPDLTSFPGCSSEATVGGTGTVGCTASSCSRKNRSVLLVLLAPLRNGCSSSHLASRDDCLLVASSSRPAQTPFWDLNEKRWCISHDLWWPDPTLRHLACRSGCKKVSGAACNGCGLTQLQCLGCVLFLFYGV